MVQRLAPFKLDVIVVGGAISGLSTALGLALSGHKVRVLEKSPAFGEPPGGIRIPPNVTKILVGWGLEEELRKRAHLPREGTDLWDFETGKLVGYLEWAEPIMQDSGAAYYQMRYSDLHEILYDAATRAGAEVILNADVRLASPPAQGSSASGKPSVQLRDGTVLHADMIVGADGQHSTMRTSIEVKHVEPQATNTLVFTANIPMKRLLEDEVLAKFETTWVYWFGPRRACVGYPIAHGREYAVHLYWDRQDPNEPEGWIPNLPVRSLNLSETALDDRLARMFEKIDAVCWQKYLDWPSIENWSDDSSRIVLVGESSRPTVPCSMQATSLCVESAAVLSTLLSYVRGFDHIPLLVRAYETIRRDRCEFLHQAEVMHAMRTMFPPGPERTARDEEMQGLLKAGQAKWDDDSFLGLWGHLINIWAYNAFDAADDWWVQWGILRERSFDRPDPNIETPYPPLKVDVTQDFLHS